MDFSVLLGKLLFQEPFQSPAVFWRTQQTFLSVLMVLFIPFNLTLTSPFHCCLTLPAGQVFSCYQHQNMQLHIFQCHAYLNLLFHFSKTKCFCLCMYSAWCVCVCVRAPRGVSENALKLTPLNAHFCGFRLLKSDMKPPFLLRTLQNSYLQLPYLLCF